MNELPTASPEGPLERTADGGVIRFRRTLAHAVADVRSAITGELRVDHTVPDVQTHYAAAGLTPAVAS